LGERLQGCQYRVAVLEQACESLSTEFPAQTGELRELAAWMAQAVR
ncbi:lipoate--protein ligase LplA, partial [Salmonella enterica subsp. enterica serovar Infantis]